MATNIGPLLKIRLFWSLAYAFKRNACSKKHVFCNQSICSIYATCTVLVLSKLKK